jgi:hypothetical protein
MANEAKLRLVIDAVLKDKAFIDAKVKIADLEKQVGGLKDKLSQTSKSGMDLGISLKQALGVMGTVASVGFLRSAVTEFANVDRSFNALEFSMRRLGIDAERELPRVRGFIESLALSGGAPVNESVKAFQRFIGITKNTETALFAVKLASDMAESGQKDMAGATDALVMILQGRAKMAANAFGLELTKISGQLKTNDELLDEAINKYFGLGEKVSDARNELDRLDAEWEANKRAIGGALAPLLGLGRQLLALPKDLGVMLGTVWNQVVTLARGFSNLWGAVLNFDALKHSPANYLRQISDAVKLANQEAVANDIGAADEIKRNHATATDDIIQTQKQKEESAAKLREIAHRAALDKETEAAEKAADKQASAELAAHIELLKAKAAATADWTPQRLAAEKAVLDAEMLQAVEAAGSAADAAYDLFMANEQKKANLENAYRMRARSQASADQAAEQDRELAAHIDLLKAKADAIENGTSERLAAEQAVLDAEFLRAIESAHLTADAVFDLWQANE